MSKKEKSDHPETISNQFLMSKLVYRMVFDQFGTFSILGYFFLGKINSALGSKIWGSQNLSFIYIDSRVCPALHGICDVLRRASSTKQFHLMYVFNLDKPFFVSFSSREPLIKKEKSDHSETISNRLLMSKLVYMMSS